MEQLTLFQLPYKYIIDASSIFSQKPNEPHRRQVYKSQWKNIDKYIQDHIIVTCSEIACEIKDKDIASWLQQNGCVILEIDDAIQMYVRKIVTEHPKMLDFTKCKSSGDAFLIATAMKYGLTVISEETDKQNKIPNICKTYGIKCVNLTELSDAEHWEF